LISLQQLAIVLGLFFAFFSNYTLAKASGGVSAEFWWGFQTWQWMFWVEMIPASLFFFCFSLSLNHPATLLQQAKHPKHWMYWLV
jgi:MFS transporter, SP family, sugar:H+ symporter